MPAVMARALAKADIVSSSRFQIDRKVAVDIERSARTGRQPDGGALALDDSGPGERRAGRQIVVGMDRGVDPSTPADVDRPLAPRSLCSVRALEQRRKAWLFGR